MTKLSSDSSDSSDSCDSSNSSKKKTVHIFFALLIVTKLKNSNRDKTYNTQSVIILKNTNFDKIQNSNCDKTQNSNCDTT